MKLKQAACFSASFSALLFGASGAFAQDAARAAPGGDAQAPEVVVTGSRIASPNLTGASPIQTVGAKEFQQTGAVNAEQLLTTLPQVIPAGVSAFSNNNNAAGGFAGAAQLNLRNLGATRTLVLVDGHRYIPYAPDGTVDINTIPTELIERVEVVTGGASAVYGSDAVAGVVNFIMKKNFNGLEITSGGGISGQGDAGRYNAGLIAGGSFGDNRGNVTLFANFMRRGALAVCARSFACPGLTDSGTGLVVNYNTTAGIGLIENFAGNPFGTTAGVAFNSDGSYHPVTNADKTNTANTLYFLDPERRISFGAQFNYKFSDALTLYGSGSFHDNKVILAAGPVGPAITNAVLQVRSPFFASATQTALAQLDATQTGVVNGVQQVANDGYVTIPSNIRRRWDEAGNREFTWKRQAFNLQLGAKGNIAPSWTYDISISDSRTTTSFTMIDASRSRYYAALNTSFASNGTLQCSDAAFRALGCVPVNIFGPGNISQAALNYLLQPLHDTGDISRVSAGGFVSGSLFDLGAGPVGLVLGAEYRRENADIEPDAARVSGDSVFPQQSVTKGSYTVKEAYTELRVPLLAHLPLVDELTLRGAARYSDYSLPGVGGVWTYAGGVEYRPVHDLLLRAQFQHAIRAPNIFELYSGLQQSATSYTDPCSSKTPVANQTASLRAVCLATGVPQAALFTAGLQPNTSGFVNGGGNTTLRAETANTYTLGAVATPSFIPRFHASLDYYHIDIKDVIGQSGGGAGGVLNLCYNVLQDASSPYCQQVVRLSTGTIYTVVATTANLARLRRNGLDLQMDYVVPLHFGLFAQTSRLRFDGSAGYVLKGERTPIIDQPNILYRCVGAFGNNGCGEPDPKFKSTLRISWENDPVTIGIKWRHISGVEDDRIEATGSFTDPATLAVPYIPAFNYFDLDISATIATVKVSLGLDNMFNKQPTVLGTGAYIQSNTWPATYDILGRYFHMSLTKKF